MALRPTSMLALFYAAAQAVLLFPAQAGATARTVEEIGTELQADCAAGRFSGVVSVTQSGASLLELHCGFANRVERTPITPATRFKIASITKPMTALVVLRLVEQGLIRLEDPVTRFLPEAPPSWSAITIRHLLQHTSGIAEQIERVEGRKQADQDAAVLAVVAELRESGHVPATAPGSKFDYANFNYELLAIAISRVTGLPFTDALDHLLFKPAGMSAAGVDGGPPVRQRLRWPSEPRPLAWGHVGSEVVDEESAAYYRGSGSIYATRDDFLSLDRALGAGSLLSPKSLERSAELAIEVAPGARQALVGLLTEVDGETVWFQWGAMDGFKPYFARVPGRQLVVLVLSNLNEVRPQLIGKALVEAALAVRRANP